jgi:acetyl esterase/lipase
MPSIRARIASTFVAWKFSDQKNASEQEILARVNSTWEQENKDEVVPTRTAETFAAKQSGETWQVFHVRPRDGPVEVGKVIVYFHGGEFHAGWIMRRDLSVCEEVNTLAEYEYEFAECTSR